MRRALTSPRGTDKRRQAGLDDRRNRTNLTFNDLNPEKAEVGRALLRRPSGQAASDHSAL